MAELCEDERRMNKKSSILITTMIVILSQASAMADERGWHHDGDRHEMHSHWDGDIHRFHERDFGRWRAGQWFHGWNAGRYAWWWIVDGVWYPYPYVIRPYPDPYQPPVVIVQQAPPVNATPATPPAPAAPDAPGASAAQDWYYCANPAGYYPYIAQCQGNWQKVPASPPPQ
jgi:hypothetical protein